MFCPVTNRARSEHKKTTTSATSSGSPTRPDRRPLDEALLLVRHVLEPGRGHGRTDHARRHRVHPDGRSVFESRRRGQRRHGRLAGRIGPFSRRRTRPADRRGAHDRAAAARQHVRRRSTDARPHSGEVHPQHTVPFRQVELVETVERRRARVVVDDRQAAQLRRRVVHGRLHGFDIAHIHRSRHPADLLGDRCSRLAVHVEHRDLRAFFGHPAARRPADPRSAAGDDGLLPLKQPHRHPPPNAPATAVSRTRAASRAS